MKLLAAITFLTSALMFAAPASAQENSKHDKAAEKPAAAIGKLIPVTPKEAAWAAKARETYPLAVCVTSDEKLGSMGDSAPYIYRVDGKPDRLVLFCCEGCEDDFKKEPAKYIAKLDAAARNKPAGKTADDKKHKSHE